MGTQLVRYDDVVFPDAGCLSKFGHRWDPEPNGKLTIETSHHFSDAVSSKSSDVFQNVLHKTFDLSWTPDPMGEKKIPTF